MDFNVAQNTLAQFAFICTMNADKYDDINLKFLPKHDIQIKICCVIRT